MVTAGEREAFFEWFEYAFDPELDECQVEAFSAGATWKERQMLSDAPIPIGWRVVPLEPTAAMVGAAEAAFAKADRSLGKTTKLRAAWAAALAAAELHNAKLTCPPRAG